MRILKTVNDKNVLTSDVYYILYCPFAVFSFQYVLTPEVSLPQIGNSVSTAEDFISQTWLLCSLKGQAADNRIPSLCTQI